MAWKNQIEDCSIEQFSLPSLFHFMQFDRKFKTSIFVRYFRTFRVFKTCQNLSDKTQFHDAIWPKNCSTEKILQQTLQYPVLLYKFKWFIKKGEIFAKHSLIRVKCKPMRSNCHGWKIFHAWNRVQQSSLPCGYLQKRRDFQLDIVH